MRIQRWLRRSLPALVALVSLGGLPAPAGADHVEPFDGPEHAFGEMVSYPLTFPVPDGVWYYDWFWAARSSGLHHAQDIFAPKGTPVVAAAAGTVVRINSSWISPTERPDGCCSVVIVHDDGWTTYYIHLDNDTPGTDDGLGWGIAEGLAIGGRVEAGQLIGYLGDSGTAEETQPHLHFELHDPDGVIVNPYDALLRSQEQPVCGVADPGPLDALVGSSGLLTSGVRGAAVRQVQRLARAYGHDPGPIDGIYGPKTAVAVRALQGDLGITADGVVGDETRAAVAEVDRVLPHRAVLDPDGRIIRWGDVGGDVADLQALLTLAEADAGPPDGVFGSMTLEAVETFQTAADLAVDGIVGPGTRGALAEALGVSGLVSCG